VLETVAKRKAQREKKRLARVKAAEEEALLMAKAALKSTSENHHKKHHHHHKSRRSKEAVEDHQLKALLKTDLDLKENGTLRRRKKRGDRERKHRESRVIDGQMTTNPQENNDQEQLEAFKKERRRSKRYHR